MDPEQQNWLSKLRMFLRGDNEPEPMPQMQSGGYAGMGQGGQLADQLRQQRIMAIEQMRKQQAMSQGPQSSLNAAQATQPYDYSAYRQ